METITRKSVMPRAARLLLAIVLSMSMPAASWAAEFVTDVMLVGAETQSQKNSLLDKYRGEGWTVVDYDLNKGCGKKSDYVYFLYKTKGNIDGFSHGYVTGFYIRTGTDYPDELNVSGVNYKLVPYVGSSHFVDMKGDLNSNAGGAYIHLYYTEAILQPETAVTSIYFDANAAGGVPADGDTGPNGYDLNKGVSGSAYIYMHFTTGSYHKADRPTTWNLSEITQDLTLGDGDGVRGTLKEPFRIAIADGATVTLLGITINIYDSKTQLAGITCEGDATIILTGANWVEGIHTYYPGIYVPEGKTLTIKGDGNLIARSGGTKMSGGQAAGIGGGRKLSSGNIVIESGAIHAVGSAYSPAIGGGYGAGGGDITIGAGISLIQAEGLNGLYPIGAGLNGTCGAINISDNLNNEVGQDINTILLYPFVVPEEPEWDGNLDKVKVNYPTCYATAKNGMTITGTLSAARRVFIAPGATVKLKDATINDFYYFISPGITCEGDATIILEGNNLVRGVDGNSPGIQVGPEGTTLTIKGNGSLLTQSGTQSMSDSYYASGIGASYFNKGSVGNLVIEGGNITAIGGENGAGIGAGYSVCGDITIKGGVVQATGGSSAPGIGAGRHSCGNINILGGTVYATGGKDGISSSSTGKASDITIADEIDMVVSTRGSSYYQFFNVGSSGTLSIGVRITHQVEDNTYTLIGLGIDDGIDPLFSETEKGAIYNLAGQRLSKMQKGINIVGGKKILK